MNGIDISHYQEGLDMKRLKEGGFDFAILKITEGTSYKDASAVDFYLAAKEAGIPVGGYCYSHATTPEQAWAEARYMLETINGFPFPLGLYLDIEEADQLALPAETLYAIAAAWCGTIQEAGYVAGLYSSEGTLWAKISANRVPKDVIVWVAHYGNQPDVPCDIWQSSDSGSVPGYNGNVDTDVVRSTRFERMVQGCAADACPIDGPCEQEDKPDVSGAFSLLAEYMQTDEFQKGFIAFAKAKEGA